MLSVAQADRLVSQHLGDTPRAAHSRVVGCLMRQLAAELSADAALWEIVGLCHDLDFFETRDEPARHGLVTAEWLADQLPPDARRAIEAHDHRSGVTAETPLSDMLKLADVLAVIDVRPGRDAVTALMSEGSPESLRAALANRPYLCDMLEHLSRKHGLALPRLATIVAAAPKQE